MTILTPAQRQQRRRDKKKAAGLIKIEIWSKPEHEKKIRDYVKKLK